MNLEPLYSPVSDSVSREVFSIYNCSGCGIGYTSPQPNDLKNYYDRSYYCNRHGFTEKYCIKRRAKIVFSEIKNARRKSLLDIGCGDGSFIKSMKTIG